MRTAKLKLATAVLAAAGLVVLVGLGTVFALAPAANPPAAQRPVGELADGDAPPEPDDKPKVDRKWRERPFPSAYPDIPALDVKFLTEFEKKHVEPIYEADPPLRKLQKAKLRVALDRIDRTLHGIDRYLTDPPKHGPHNLLFSTVEPLSAQTREAVAVALDLSTGAEARRPWLVLRVAAEKRVEGVIESFGSKLGFGRMDNDVPRLDAEIELAKFDKAK